MLAHATEIGDRKAIRQLEEFDRQAADFPTMDFVLSAARTPLMNKYHIGVTHAPISTASIAMDILFSFGGYTVGEKMRYVQGMGFSGVNVFPQIFEDNLFSSARSFDVPVYIMHGKWDYQVSQVLSEAWFDGIEAPAKGYFLFENSAHSPNVEETEKFVRIVREITGN